MNQVVCNYAPLHFLPYREVGEFVNVGVVVHCPQTDFFDFRLVPLKRTGRVTGFFPELDAKLFKTGLQGFARELDRIRAGHRLMPLQKEVAPDLAIAQMARFQEVIRRREGLLHFGEPGTLMAVTGEEALTELYGRFVERQFAQKREYQEVVMRNRLARLLRDWKLTEHYVVNQKIGDADFHVVMPFVHYVDTIPMRVIKPLDLNKADTSDIYHHGGAWVKNMERLKARQKLPPAVVFTVRLPEMGKQRKAADEICQELSLLGVQPVDFGRTQQIHEAALVDNAA
jgi:hypothetical protein